MADFEVRFGGRLQYGSVQKLVKLKRVKTSKTNLYDAVSAKPDTTSGAHRIQKWVARGFLRMTTRRIYFDMISKIKGGLLRGVKRSSSSQQPNNFS